MVILTNPNNPTTVVYSRKSMEALADFVKRMISSLLLTRRLKISYLMKKKW